jgi:hypothetical protein
MRICMEISEKHRTLSSSFFLCDFALSLQWRASRTAREVIAQD